MADINDGLVEQNRINKRQKQCSCQGDESVYFTSIRSNYDKKTTIQQLNKYSELADEHAEYTSISEHQRSHVIDSNYMITQINNFKSTDS